MVQFENCKICATELSSTHAEQPTVFAINPKAFMVFPCLLFCFAAFCAGMQSHVAQQPPAVAPTPAASGASSSQIIHVCAVGSFRRPAEVQRHAPCLCWVLIIRQPTVELAATFARGIINTEGMLQRARIVRIECDMVMSFVEMRRPSRIAPLIDQLEGRSDVVAEPWLGARHEGVGWVNQQSASGFGGLRVILDLNRAIDVVTTPQGRTIFPAAGA